MKGTIRAGSVALLSGLLAVAAAARDPEAVRQKLEALRARIERIEAGLAAETARRDALQAELADAERRVGAAVEALRRVQGDLDQVHARLDELHRAQRQVETELKDQRGRLAASVRAAFAMGREPRLKMLLNQEDPAAAGRVLAYYHYLQQARITRMDAVAARLESLRRIAAQITRRRAQLAALEGKRATRLAAERAAMAERAAVLARIRERIEAQGAQLSALQRDEQALLALLEKLEHALADIPPRLAVPFASLKGNLIWPVDRVAGSNAEDNGVLIAAPAGTPVRAVAAGRVAFAEWLRGYGLLIILDHGDGYMSLYAHNRSLFRDVGDWVQAGEVIAEVGKSGGRAAAALYFELRHAAQPVPVLAWLGKR